MINNLTFGTVSVLSFFVFLLIIASGALSSSTAGKEITAVQSLQCVKCHEMEAAYDAWERGAHRGIDCGACHNDLGFLEAIQMKTGAAWKRFASSVTPPRPIDIKAAVPRASCLKCHPNSNQAIHRDISLKCAICHKLSAHQNPDPVPRKRLEIKQSDQCVSCHLDINKIGSSKFKNKLPETKRIEGLCCNSSASPSTEKENFLINRDYLKTVHGLLGCIACHGGKNTSDAIKAHQDLQADPSEGKNNICVNCHTDIVLAFKNSSHNNIPGIKRALKKSPYVKTVEATAIPEAALEKNCLSCHATCGQCHFSRPNSTGGGLLSNHLVNKRPPIEKTCFYCHNAGAGGEFIGVVGIAADAHYTKGKMDCYSCHNVDILHGISGTKAGEKPMSKAAPKCVDCHQEALSKNTKNIAHKAHPKNTLTCQVCHALPYNNCYYCHISASSEGKIVSESSLVVQLKIGLNPQRNKMRPEKYVVLRRVPAALADTSATADKVLLAEDDEISSWRLTWPHNIQKITPQNKSCDRCHDNESYFLTEKDLSPGERRANQKMMVRGLPGKRVKKD